MPPTALAATPALLLAVVAAAWAGDGGGPPAESAGRGAPVTTATRTAPTVTPSADEGTRSCEPRPFLHPSLGDAVRTRVESGLALSAARLEALPACRALFTALGAEGVDALNTTLCFPLRPHRRVAEMYRGRNIAVTSVGGSSTFLCPEFAKLPVEHAAMYLLHEALHHAGLSEHPHLKSAPTSREISAMVAARCGL